MIRANKTRPKSFTVNKQTIMPVYSNWRSHQNDMLAQEMSCEGRTKARALMWRHDSLGAGSPSSSSRVDQAEESQGAPKHKCSSNPNKLLSTSMRILLTGNFLFQDMSYIVLTAQIAPHSSFLKKIKDAFHPVLFIPYDWYQKSNGAGYVDTVLQCRCVI